MTIEELETVLSKYNIIKVSKQETGLESKSIPSMLSTFRCLIINNIPPTQEEFINKFKEQFGDLKGNISRLKKAYLSFIREYHLGYLLRKYFTNVVYDEQLDILGIDYIIYYNGLVYNIHAYVGTENGKYWRKIKNGRHNFTGTHIDLPINLNDGKRVGKFILYDESYIEKLKVMMSPK
jgi:hypothetical protein